MRIYYTVIICMLFCKVALGCGGSWLYESGKEKKDESTTFSYDSNIKDYKTELDRVPSQMTISASKTTYPMHSDISKKSR